MITYLLNFVLCSGLLLLVYRAFLGNEKLYKFNRFYLLFSLAFSLAVPLITIKVLPKQIPLFTSQIISPPVAPVANIQVDQSALTQHASPIIKGPVYQQTIAQPVAPIINTPVHQQFLETPAPAYNYLPLLIAVYLIIAIGMLLRFTKNLYHINRSVAKNAIRAADGTKLILVDEEVTPHSFLNYVFINKKDYRDGAVEPEIICHEQAHVQQLHSLDVIFVELLQVICWFNPVIPFYRRAIQLNHEFLADEAVIKSYDDTPAYQHLLLSKASQCGSLYLTSQFNYLTTKKRLTMMTKTTSAATAWFARLAIIPVVTIAFLLFCNKTMAELEAGSAMKTNMVFALQDTKIDKVPKLPADYKPAKTYINSKGYKIDEGGYSADGKTYYVAIISNKSGGKLSDANDKTGRIIIYKGSGNAAGEEHIFHRYGYKFPDVKVSEFKPGPKPPVPMMIPDKGFNALMQYSSKIEYPQQALDHEIQGNVVAKFNVDKDHKITDVKLVSGIGYGCDEQVLDMLKSFTGRVNGKYNNYVVDISFWLFGRTKSYPRVHADSKIINAPNMALGVGLTGFGK
jgi:hypothetical protein